MGIHYARRIELAARVQDLLAEYVHCLDDGRFEEWPNFFVETCRYQVTTAENHQAGMPICLIDCDSRAMLVDRVQALRQANIFEAHTYRHIVAPTRIRRELAGNVVEAQTGFVVMRTMHDGETSVFITGQYLDRLSFASDNAPPSIVERIVVCDSSRIDTLLVLPL